MLVDQLPPDSATIRSMAGEPGWTVTDHLLANVVDLIAVGNWLFVQAHTSKRAANPQPKPLPRFGSRREEPKGEAVAVGANGLAAFLGLAVDVNERGAQ